MRRVLFAVAVILTFCFASVTAGASDPCPAPVCRDITGVVTDPHGEPIENYEVWAKTTNGYEERTRTDASGRYDIHLPVDNLDGCPVVGGQPDQFYTGASHPSKLCKDAVVNLHPQYRVVAEAPAREQFFADHTKPVTFTLRLYANSQTFPARFAGDPLTWTMTNHSAATGAKTIAGQANFTAPVVQKVDGVYRYVWSASLTARVDAPTMVHVDWGRGTVFGQMMDCRMLFIGLGISSVTPAKAIGGQVVTLNGVNFGVAKGRISMNGYGYDAWIDPNLILEWTPTRIQYVLPVDAKNSWIRVYTRTGVGPFCLGGAAGAPTQRMPIKVGLV